ncbi:MAG: radical SAM protein [Candidatus Omnitrophica bacterium]|nr:radical SAM protein [Candidatus Omnitrophota bacterium]
MNNTQQQFKHNLEQIFDFSLNFNQLKDIQRLFHEIKIRDQITEQQIISKLTVDQIIQNSNGRNKFVNIKRHLIDLRFPLSSKNQAIDPGQIFLAELKPSLTHIHPQSANFIPELIYIEEKAKNSYLSQRFTEKFPDTQVIIINNCLEYVKNNQFDLKDLKKPIVFIVQENWDFIKPCPCTKNHIGCNYWIFNLGFGCPYDCSYCFLQQYTNFPGIVLPANLDDFFQKFDAFYQKINQPIRIGTGEFCDSLALDYITGYAEKLIEFFRDKPVYFELKTKSNNISNILKLKASKNIIISWSLNPQSIVKAEELLTANLEQRLDAALAVQEKGFSLGFHFDPVIYSENWQELYQQVIDLLYKRLKPPFSWISIGTLRGTRKLKNAAELRFPESNIFYGELFLGPDKKLRYPKFLRKQIYHKMQEMIRKYDPKTPVYLCMEDADCWQTISNDLQSSKAVEKYLIADK